MRSVVTEEGRKPWDFFISYASEDRESVATPLADCLSGRGLKVWLDHRVLAGTDKLADQIQEGLSDCHYGIVIGSPRFLAKDWPIRELDTLFAIETIDGRHRIAPILHNMSDLELAEKAPEIYQRRPISTAQGFECVCDEILDRVVASTDRQRQETLGEFVSELPRFRAPGVLSCESATCSWQVPADWPSFLRSVGPEFTLKKLGQDWCIVCAACGAPVGSLTSEEAKEIAAKIRVNNVWAPSRRQSTLKAAAESQEGGDMKRALFLELLDEEASIPRGAKGAFKSADDLVKMLEARNALATKMEEAKGTGQLTQEQYEQLVALNRRHSMPQL